ncbi:MAG: chemotaxis protein MotB [Candidatus Sumerlaeota bacterium]|nr:chemotaxis protein MotB [Candidatus Sumerlaeota bacterium]
MPLRFPILLLPLLLTVGCFAKINKLQDDNTLLRAQVLQYEQDYRALQTRYAQLETQIEEARAKSDALDKELSVLKDRNALMRRVMDESQKSQAEALVKDMEDRVARENQLRLELDQTAAQIEKVQNEAALLESERDAAQALAEELRKTLEETSAKLTEMTNTSETLRTERDDARAERDDFRRQVQALQSNSTDLSKKLEEVSGALRDRDKDLATAKREAEDLRASLAASEAASRASSEKRDALRAKLREALATDIASGALSLPADGPARLIILSDSLYEPRTVLLTDSARALLVRVAEALASLPWDSIRIEGHTDSQPVASMPFVDNWDLAAARASAVTRFLAQQKNIPARKLSASSHSFYAPIASNETAEGRRENRRVEIVILPANE